MEAGVAGGPGQHVAGHVGQEHNQGPDYVTAQHLLMVVTSALGQTSLPLPAIHNAALLMVSGHPGQAGPIVAQHVVEEHQQDQDHALAKQVEENLALGTTLKARVVTRNVALLMVFGHPGQSGLTVAKNVVGELHEEPGLAMARHVVEMFALGAVMKAWLAMSNAVLLMEYGNPGHPGQNAAKYVVVEHQQERDHAVVNYVEEGLALGTKMI